MTATAIAAEIERAFGQIMRRMGQPMKVPLTDATVLLETGLDSMGFAMLVTQLEDDLGYDPFVIMEDAVYPRTYGEFVAIYESYQDRAHRNDSARRG